MMEMMLRSCLEEHESSIAPTLAEGSVEMIVSGWTGFRRECRERCSRQERCDYQIHSLPERLFVGQQGSREKSAKCRGAPIRASSARWRGWRPEGDSRSEIEREGDGGKEAGVVEERDRIGLAGGMAMRDVAGGSDVGVHLRGSRRF